MALPDGAKDPVDSLVMNRADYRKADSREHLLLAETCHSSIYRDRQVTLQC